MDKLYYKNIDETVYHTITKNGLDVHIIKKEGFANKCAYFATKFGSFNTGDILVDNKEEIPIIGGLAHFLEHRVFDYKKGNVMDLFYKLGADVNAYTSYDRTVYYFSTCENFGECLELLLDFPTSFTMTKEAVENEKDIIVNELLMYKDDPNDKLYKGLMNALYKEHPIRFDVGGEPEEVRKTTIELLNMVHSTFYSPKNMHLVIVGDIDLDSTIDIIERKEFKQNGTSYKKKKIVENMEVVEEKKIITCDVKNQRLLIGYKLSPLDNLYDIEKSRIFSSLDLLMTLLFAPSSDFYKQMIDDKYISSLSFDIMQYEGLFSILIEADILKDYEVVFEKVNNRLKDALESIDETKLESAKKKEISIIVKGSDSCTSLAKNYITYVLDNMNYCKMIELIKSIDIKDLTKAYEYIKDAHYSYVLLKPEKEY